MLIKIKLLVKMSIKVNVVLARCTLCYFHCVIFTINIGIGTYFVYSHWYLKKYDTRVMLDTRTETAIY